MSSGFASKNYILLYFLLNIMKLFIYSLLHSPSGLGLIFNFFKRESNCLSEFCKSTNEYGYVNAKYVVEHKFSNVLYPKLNKLFLS